MRLFNKTPLFNPPVHTSSVNVDPLEGHIKLILSESMSTNSVLNASEGAIWCVMFVWDDASWVDHHISPYLKGSGSKQQSALLCGSLLGDVSVIYLISLNIHSSSECVKLTWHLVSLDC